MPLRPACDVKAIEAFQHQPLDVRGGSGPQRPQILQAAEGKRLREFRALRPRALEPARQLRLTAAKRQPAQVAPAEHQRIEENEAGGRCRGLLYAGGFAFQPLLQTLEARGAVFHHHQRAIEHRLAIHARQHIGKCTQNIGALAGTTPCRLVRRPVARARRHISIRPGTQRG